MAVPALWPWGIHLLMSLLSLGSGLDTLEGESPATFQPPSPSRTPKLSLWLVGWLTPVALAVLKLDLLDQAGLEHTDLPASASQELRLKLYSMTDF